MALPAPIQAILARFRGTNNNAWNASSNPLGFGQGGHRQNLPPRLNDLADVLDFVSDTVDAVDADAQQTAQDRVQTGQDREAASQSATASASQATRLFGTSTTSNTSTIANKTFTTQADKAFDVGSFVMIQSRGTLNRWMFGRVTAYSGTSLTVAVEVVGTTTSAGTDWDIRVASARGAQGPQGTNRIPVDPRSTNTALTAAENAEFIDCTGTFTQTFVAAATLGAGWQVVIRSNTGTVTLDPNGSELIDGATTLAVGPGETRQVICTGTGFVSFLIDAPAPPIPGLVFISQQTISTAVATVDFTGLSSAYDEYILTVNGFMPSEAATIYMRTSTNGGAAYDAAAGDYYNKGFVVEASSVSFITTAAASQILLTGAQSLTTTASWGGTDLEIRMSRPSATDRFKIRWTGAYQGAPNITSLVNGAAQRNAIADVDAVRLFLSSGTIAAGTFKLYGLRKS